MTYFTRGDRRLSGRGMHMPISGGPPQPVGRKFERGLQILLTLIDGGKPTRHAPMIARTRACAMTLGDIGPVWRAR